MFRGLALVLSLVSSAPALFATQLDPSHQLVISVRDQKLMLVENGGKVATYPVSTSMFGVGDSWGRMTTPIGYLVVEKKIGDNVPSGAVFHNRRLTGEILQANAPGRDPVITHHLVTWIGSAERARISAWHLYPWHTAGENNRSSCQLWLHSDEIERRSGAVQSRSGGSSRADYSRPTSENGTSTAGAIDAYSPGCDHTTSDSNG